MGLQHRWQTKKTLFIQCRRPGSLQRCSLLGEFLHTSSHSVNAPALTDALEDQSPTASPSLHLCLSYANILYFKHNYCGHQKTGSTQHPQPAHMHRSVLNLDMDSFSLSGYMLIGLKTVNLLTVNSGIAEQGSACLLMKNGSNLPAPSFIPMVEREYSLGGNKNLTKNTISAPLLQDCQFMSSKLSSIL